MEISIWYEMSQGRGAKMYTLWRCSSAMGGKRTFVKNLGIDHDKSFEKAKLIAGILQRIKIK